MNAHVSIRFSPDVKVELRVSFHLRRGSAGTRA